MKHIKYITILAFTVFSFTSCESEDSFLESDYLGVVSPSKVADYDLLLNGSDLVSTFSFENSNPVMYMTDDILLSSSQLNRLNQSNYAAYIWEPFIYESDTDPAVWTKGYNNIFTYNTILTGIDNATDATSSNQNKELISTIKAEALVGRAYEYLILVNLFAQPYSAENATSPGIPYVTFANISDEIPDRETLADTYQKIKEDLETAIPNLPDLNSENTRASKIAAYGLLARMSLYMGKYDDVLTYTNLALDIKSDYQDYNDPSFRLPFTPSDNTDNVYSRTIGAGNLFFGASATEELNNMYSFSDSRKFSFYIGSNYGAAFFGIDHGISMPELILNKAEALARKNRLTDALNLLMDFQEKRVFAAPKLSSTDKEEVITWVLKERRKELIVKGLRFFDMRRLQLEGRINTVEHSKIGGETTANLTPGSPRYTLAIPRSVLAKNPGMEQNPR